MPTLRQIPYDVSVGATSTEVIKENPKRISAIFVNDSNETIYLRLGTDATANTGIRLNASGGGYEINLANPWYGAIYAICASGGKQLCCQEVSYAH